MNACARHEQHERNTSATQVLDEWDTRDTIRT